MLRRVAVVRIDVLDEYITSIIKVTRIVELGTTLTVASNRKLFLRSVLLLLVTANVSSSLIIFTMMIEAIRCSETSAHTKATRRHIPGDDILHCHRGENIKSYNRVVD
jgi:hypothetical protein